MPRTNLAEGMGSAMWGSPHRTTQLPLYLISVHFQVHGELFGNPANNLTPPWRDAQDF